MLSLTPQMELSLNPRSVLEPEEKQKFERRIRELERANMTPEAAEVVALKEILQSR